MFQSVPSPVTTLLPALTEAPAVKLHKDNGPVVHCQRYQRMTSESLYKMNARLYSVLARCHVCVSSPQAVCCEDHLHCCPHGTVCNLAASTCDDPTGGAVVPWLSKVPAFPLLTDNNKCDKSTSCPGKSTCCKTASGGWACCPLPQVTVTV